MLTVPWGSVRLVSNVHVRGVVVLAFPLGIVPAESTVQGLFEFLHQLVRLLPYLYLFFTANGPDDRVISTVRRTIVFLLLLQI